MYNEMTSSNVQAKHLLLYGMTYEEYILTEAIKNIGNSMKIPNSLLFNYSIIGGKNGNDA